MRAVRYEGPEKGVVVDRAAREPVPEPGEALLRPRRVAISSADLELCEGPKPQKPRTLGHEFVAVVDRAVPLAHQKDRAKALMGKRVVGVIATACGSCDLCRSGLSAHCRERTVLGIDGRNGCFADAFTLPISNLYAVPDSLDDDRAVFAELLAAAHHAVQMLRIQGKPYVTVLGDSAMGLLCAQLMAALNASVRVIGRHEHKMEIAGKWGVKHRHQDEIGLRADQDVVVDCTGTPEGLATAMALVRPRGKILLKGTLLPGRSTATIDLSPIVQKELEVIGSRTGPLAEAVELLVRDAVDVVSLITKRARLDDAPEALRAARDPAQIKVVMDV